MKSLQKIIEKNGHQFRYLGTTNQNYLHHKPILKSGERFFHQFEINFEKETPKNAVHLPHLKEIEKNLSSNSNKIFDFLPANIPNLKKTGSSARIDSKELSALKNAFEEGYLATYPFSKSKAAEQVFELLGLFDVIADLYSDFRKNMDYQKLYHHLNDVLKRGNGILCTYKTKTVPPVKINVEKPNLK